MPFTCTVSATQELLEMTDTKNTHINIEQINVLMPGQYNITWLITAFTLLEQLQFNDSVHYSAHINITAFLMTMLIIIYESKDMHK